MALLVLGILADDATCHFALSIATQDKPTVFADALAGGTDFHGAGGDAGGTDAAGVGIAGEPGAAGDVVEKR